MTNWYRTYSDKWLEQGGYNPTLIPDGFMSISFNLPHENTNYFFTNLFLGNRATNNGWNSGAGEEVKSSRKTTSTEITGDGIGGGRTWYGFMWYCTGY